MTNDKLKDGKHLDQDILVALKLTANQMICVVDLDRDKHYFNGHMIPSYKI